MAREFFNAYHSYLQVMESLNDAERGRLFTACLTYSMTGEAQELHGNERFVFPGIRSQIDRDKKKYAIFCDKQSENIGKRWNKKNTKDTNVYHGIPDDTKHTYEKEKEKEKEKEIPLTGKRASAKKQTVQFSEFVSMTNDEYASLVEKLGENGAKRCVEILNNYKGSSGKKYKSDYLTILNWVVKRYDEERVQGGGFPENRQQVSPDGSSHRDTPPPRKVDPDYREKYYGFKGA